MIKRLTIEEKRRITRQVYEKHGYHVEHFYPFTALPIRPARIRIDAAPLHEVRMATEAAICEAEYI